MQVWGSAFAWRVPLVLPQPLLLNVSKFLRIVEKNLFRVVLLLCSRLTLRFGILLVNAA